ncbi:thioredoxin family protein [Flavobacterium sp.]|uniref:thioredoxin family protein n=1 Tax=Flavobacterium sp. TaxID=239 RepID=UPI00260A8096|nr:thioredoxin family protein [Flavobacterium sp.]
MKKIGVLLFLLISSVGFSQNWKTSFEEAKQEANKENKKILLVFSGSDWCAPCMKLEKNVWKSDAFKKVAEEKYVLIKADYPKKKANQLSAELTESNNKLAEKYNKEGNFPLVVMLDKNGKVQGMTGFKNISAEEYIKLLATLEK